MPVALYPPDLTASLSARHPKLESIMLPVESGAWVILASQNDLAPWIKKN